ncbi:hypothetical protein BKA61DRAFT_584010 [Leptodontidium sp. MPI-SDFR-AT-0119]|nr:hypothetical protein BKA61DRAFT_584010 [Leptodontidium sp. MPI-SDFR-AT-0119]
MSPLHQDSLKPSVEKAKPLESQTEKSVGEQNTDGIYDVLVPRMLPWWRMIAAFLIVICLVHPNASGVLQLLQLKEAPPRSAMYFRSQRWPKTIPVAEQSPPASLFITSNKVAVIIEYRTLPSLIPGISGPGRQVVLFTPLSIHPNSAVFNRLMKAGRISIGMLPKELVRDATRSRF